MGKVTITGLEMSVTTKEGEPDVALRYDGKSVRLTVAEKNLNFDADALQDVIDALSRLQAEVRPGRAG